MKVVTGLGKYLSCIVLIILTLFILSINSEDKLSWTPVERILVEVTAPVQNFITQTVRMTKDVWLKYFFLVDVYESNLKLKREINAIRMENARYRELLASLPRIERLLNLTQKYKWPVIAARVIGWDPSGWFQSVIIDKGENAGLKLDMPVVNSYGIVGRVVSVSPSYAKVLLIIDQNSAVDCIDQRTRDRGMVKGKNTSVCDVAYMNKSCEVKKGDIIVTSGFGGVFPKGIPIGTVTEVKQVQGELFKQVKIKTCVDFSKLEEVLIIKDHPQINFGQNSSEKVNKN